MGVARRQKRNPDGKDPSVTGYDLLVRLVDEILQRREAEAHVALGGDEIPKDPESK